jgi:predicted CopG family antitoxin
MPPKGYSNITVREEVREELEKLRQEIGIRDFSDLLVLLVKSYREYTSKTSKIEEILTSLYITTYNYQ